MKKLVILSTILLVIACRKKSGNDEGLSYGNNQIKSIKDPIVFFDTLGKGEMEGGSKINFIRRYQYGVTNHYYFEYYDQSNKLKSVIYEAERHPQSCAGARYDFYYNGNRIDRVEKKAVSSGCSIVTRVFKYNYFPSGALKSIINTTGNITYETFFSYNSMGRIDKIFNGSRANSESNFQYSEISYSYDEYGNVKMASEQNSYSNKITKKTEFVYDSASNPFKGNYILLNSTLLGQLHSLGPLFLSQNNVRQATQYILETGNKHEYSYQLSYTNTLLSEFGYFDQFTSFVFYN